MLAIMLSGFFVNGSTPSKDVGQNSSKISYGYNLVNHTYAAGEAKAGATNNDEWKQATWSETTKNSETLGTFVDVLNIILSVMSFVMTPIIMLAGWLLSPDWTFGDVFNMRDTLHQLWVLISNLVYVVFAFLLIVIAFRNIFWDAKGVYAMKTWLPRLLVGVLMVPFTWFIVSGTLSVANVITASVIQLPSSVIPKAGWIKILDNIWIPKKVYVNLKWDASWSSSGPNLQSNGEWLLNNSNPDGSIKDGATPPAFYKWNSNFYAADCDIESSRSECIKASDFLLSWWKGVYGLLIPYAYGIFKIQDIKQIDKKQILENVIKNTWDIVNKLLFWALFYAAFGFICMALVAALFMRAVYIWIYAIFSPLFALSYFFEWKLPGGKVMESMSITKFISLAFVPVITSAGLAFGLMFLSFAMNMPSNSTWNTATATRDGTDMTLTIWDLSLVTKWAFDAKDKDWSNNKDKGSVANESTTEGVLDITQSLIGKVIINFLAIMLLWGIVKATLSAHEITKKVADPIFKFGETLAKSAPILPNWMSIGSMQAASRIPQQTLDTKINEQLRASGLQQAANKTFGVDAMNAEVMKSELRNIIQTTGWTLTSKDDIRKAAQKVDQIASQFGTTSHQYQEATKMYIDALKKTETTVLDSAGIRWLGALDSIDVKKDTAIAWAVVALGAGKTTDINSAKQYYNQHISGWSKSESETSKGESGTSTEKPKDINVNAKPIETWKPKELDVKLWEKTVNIKIDADHKVIFDNKSIWDLKWFDETALRNKLQTEGKLSPEDIEATIKALSDIFKK